jgi:hypothetical protein
MPAAEQHACLLQTAARIWQVVKQLATAAHLVALIAVVVVLAKLCIPTAAERIALRAL